MSDLRVTDAAGLKAALSDAPAGAVIELEEGDYEGAWHLRKSVTLRAAGERGDASLWGTGGSVVRVTDDDLVVKIERLTIGDGNAETGGGVHLSGFSRVTLDDCLLEGNTATGGPGGAAAVEAGTLTLKFCDVLNNEAVGGVALAATGVGTLVLHSCLVQATTSAQSAAVVVRGGAEAKIDSTSIVCDGGAAVLVAGTASQRPDVSVTHSTLNGEPSLQLRAQFAGRTTVKDSTLSSPAQGVYKPEGTVNVA